MDFTTYDHHTLPTQTKTNKHHLRALETEKKETDFGEVSKLDKQPVKSDLSVSSFIYLFCSSTLRSDTVTAASKILIEKHIPFIAAGTRGKSLGKSAND